MARSRGMVAPINSIKHYVQKSSSAIASGAILTQVWVNAITKGAARATTADVEEGAIVKAVFIELWLSGVVDQQATWILCKRPAGVAAPTATEMSNLGTYKNKKNILLAGQGLTPSGGNQIAMFKGWYAIPKGKQRFGLGDILSCTILSVGDAARICGLATFKEYE